MLAQTAHSLELAGVAANAVSIDNRAVVWETVAGEGGGTTAVVERDLRARRTRTFARDVAPQYGLAATADWIVYALATAHRAWSPFAAVAAAGAFWQIRSPLRLRGAATGLRGRSRPPDANG